MSTSSARSYAQRAKNEGKIYDAALHLERAIEELAKTIRDLEHRIERLEAEVRRLS